MNLVAEARQSVKEISWQELESKNPEDFLLIDVREPHEVAEKPTPGAINIPRGMIEFNIQNHPDLKELSEAELMSARLCLFCALGARSALAAQSLGKLGFTHVFSVQGGVNLRD
jgi:rhodanese-related sulfurtransferase